MACAPDRSAKTMLVDQQGGPGEASDVGEISHDREGLVVRRSHVEVLGQESDVDRPEINQGGRGTK